MVYPPRADQDKDFKGILKDLKKLLRQSHHRLAVVPSAAGSLSAALGMTLGTKPGIDGYNTAP